MIFGPTGTWTDDGRPVAPDVVLHGDCHTRDPLASVTPQDIDQAAYGILVSKVYTLPRPTNTTFYEGKPTVLVSSRTFVADRRNLKPGETKWHQFSEGWIIERRTSDDRYYVYGAPDKVRAGSGLVDLIEKYGDRGAATLFGGSLVIGTMHMEGSAIIEPEDKPPANHEGLGIKIRQVVNFWGVTFRVTEQEGMGKGITSMKLEAVRNPPPAPH